MKKLLIFLILTSFINCFAMHLDYSYEVQNNSTIIPANIIFPEIGTQGTAGATVNIPNSNYIPEIFGQRVTNILEEFIPI